MEDGNNHNSIVPENNASLVGEKKSNNTSDKYYINANGGSDLFNKVDKKNNSSINNFHFDNDISHYKASQEISLTKNTNKQIKSEQTQQIVKPIPRPIITKHSTFKTVVKRYSSDDHQPVPRVYKENGDYTSHSNVQSTSSEGSIDEDALQKAIIKLHNSTNSKSKHKTQQVACKKRRVDESGASAQYLGLQPAVKFKCSKCASTFPSLAMLKHHQGTCAPPVTTPSCIPLPPPTTALQSSGDTNLRFTRSVYLCSACGTYYENWNLFLHIREVHNRHTCLFCFGMFSQAQKLASHLVVKHNIQEDYFTSKEDLSSKFSQSFYLLCCKCEKVFTEREDFVSHECTPVVKHCSVCKLKGSHSPLCPKNSKIKKLNSSLDLDVKKIKSKPQSRLFDESPVSLTVDSGHLQDPPVKSKPTGVESSATDSISSSATNPDTSSETLNWSQDTNISTIVSDNNQVNSCSSFSNSNTSSHPTDVDAVDNPVSDLTNNNNKQELITSPPSDIVQDTVETSAVQTVEAGAVHTVEAGVVHTVEAGAVHTVEAGAVHTVETSTVPDTPEHQQPVRPPDEDNNVCQQESDINQENMETNTSLHDTNSVSAETNETSEYSLPTSEPQVLYQIHPSVSWPRKYTPQLPSKPPPRNRRPPKRYQTTEEPEEPVQPSVLYTPPPVQPIVYQLPEQPIVQVSEVKETINRVPKLTVKIPKTIMEKESTSDYSSESDDSDKLTVDVDATGSVPPPVVESLANNDSDVEEEEEEQEVEEAEPEVEAVEDANDTADNGAINSSDPDIAVAGEDIPITELTLDFPLDKYTLRELLKVFLNATRYNCIYCNHARKIAVNGKQLGLHFVAQHRFSATVDSITAEELLPDTIVQKIKLSLEDVQNIYLNLEGFDTDDKSEMKLYDQTLECFQCFYITTLQKDLYSHNRKMHQKTILLCIMCKSNFYSYSELLCHLCPGTYNLNSEIPFHCCLCPKDAIPSAFRLMVHLRKCHNACDVCLESCHNQSRLSNHVWKHKLHHLCYRCGIAYRNKPDITKHLFWKHGTESVLCKKCLQKRWPHVYHFCIPPNTFICEECNLSFTKAVSLKVHKRFHNNDFPYSCAQENCEEKFVSKKLLKKHEIKHLEPTEHLEDPPKQESPVDDKNDIIVIDDNEKPDDVVAGVEEKADNKTTSTKPKKSKKNKKNREKNNLLIDVNLPALNLSESDSSEESDTESSKKTENAVQETADSSVSAAEPMITDDLRAENLEEVKNEATVPDVWDNFKMYQAQIEKESVSLQPPKPRHVCDSDHDYCVIPMSDYEQLEEQHRLNIDRLSPNKENKKKQKAKKKANKKENGSSSSDSSSDSDSSCSCGSNCSCSSSSGSSSSSSSSGSDSESSLSPQQTTSPAKPHKDSDASAVDVVMPLPEPVELPIAESDLDTDETDTDEDFYDEHPQRLANKILERNKLLLLATVAPSVNNGTYLDSSRPPTPEPVDAVPEAKKKVKNKKKKRTKKSTPLVPPIKIPLRPEEPPVNAGLNKITISLQTNTVIDKSGTDSPKMFVSTPSDHDNKRASKRRRVPNKFYGYSSDEEYVQKQQMPPKLEWRKEDLPSSSGVQQQLQQPPVIPEYSSIALMPVHESRPVVSPKLVMREPIYTSSEDEDSDSSREGALQINHPIAENVEPVSNRMFHPPISHPYSGRIPFPRPAGVRQAREGESVYCYCRCPYDEVSEMIACDAEGCSIEWFHFECVGIMVPPKGKWFCPDCRQKEEYYGQM